MCRLAGTRHRPQQHSSNAGQRISVTVPALDYVQVRRIRPGEMTGSPRRGGDPQLPSSEVRAVRRRRSAQAEAGNRCARPVSVVRWNAGGPSAAHPPPSGPMPQCAPRSTRHPSGLQRLLHHDDWIDSCPTNDHDRPESGHRRGHDAITSPGGRRQACFCYELSVLMSPLAATLPALLVQLHVAEYRSTFRPRPGGPVHPGARVQHPRRPHPWPCSSSPATGRPFQLRDGRKRLPLRASR